MQHDAIGVAIGLAAIWLALYSGGQFMKWIFS
jgi:hypothetical protein